MISFVSANHLSI